MLRVLIVDDQKERRERLSRALATHLSPFAVSEAASGADCLRQLSSASWDALVLTDRLPDADGLEVLDRVRAAGIDVPVLLLAAPGDAALAAEAMRRRAAESAFRSGDLEQSLGDVVAQAILRHRQKDPAEGARAPSRSRLEPVLQSARAAWHEVNNPLFAIEGSVQLLLAAGCGDNEAHRVHLDRIQRACERIRAAMQQLREATLTALQALEGQGTPLDFRDHLPPVSYDP